jgi:hypothetical protein
VTVFGWGGDNGFDGEIVIDSGGACPSSLSGEVDHFEFLRGEDLVVSLPQMSEP